MNLQEVNLRTPSEAEFLELAQLSFENFVEESALSTGQSAADLKEKFGGPPTRRNETDFWLVVESGERRVGFVWFQIIPKENSAFGWDIYLAPEFRSKGVGRYVMQKCGEQLLQLGINSVKICVFEHNEIARRLYESLGFVVEKFDAERRQFTLVLGLN